MGQQIFTYIIHKNGVADDSALELVSAAKKIDANASITAVVIGSGGHLDTVCNEMASSYEEVWKIDNDALSYPTPKLLEACLSIFCRRMQSFLLLIIHLGGIFRRVSP